MQDIIVVISNWIIPIVIVGVIVYGLVMNVAVYDEFIAGAKKGFTTVLNIMPTLIGLMVAVGILRASGFLEWLASALELIIGGSGFPTELVPLSLVKMFSSSAATGLLLDIYETYGVDSQLGMTASIMLSSTETIFYTMSIYFMSVKITKTRWTLAGAIVATVAGVLASVWLGSR
ncbi:MAG: spore maturation protein [Eubacteriales bacterium]